MDGGRRLVDVRPDPAWVGDVEAPADAFRRLERPAGAGQCAVCEKKFKDESFVHKHYARKHYVPPDAEAGGDAEGAGAQGAWKQGNQFLEGTAERGDLNQYWYSNATLRAMGDEVEGHATRAGFLSTPSVYFSLGNEELRQRSGLFDLDEQWGSEAGFVRYDFNHPEALPDALQGQFDYLVIDPPFITEEVWRMYAKAAKHLLDPAKGKLLCSTVPENAPFMEELLGVRPVVFQPSIPNLVYQYVFYTNYEPTALGVVNDEVATA